MVLTGIIMGNVNFSYITKILIVFSLFFSGSVIADVTNNSRSVFVFQQKLAAKGNVNAIYKLGYMYEMGEGVDLNMEEAKKSYKSAAAMGYEPAKLRLTYLDVKINGYDTKKNADWLQSVKSQSSGSTVESLEALFLQGQLYREGLGLKKNLQKSLAIMYRLSMEGVTAADEEILKIEAEITAKQQKRYLADQKKKKQAEKRQVEKRQAEMAWARKQVQEAEAAEKRKAATAKAAAVNDTAKTEAVSPAAEKPVVTKPASGKPATGARPQTASQITSKGNTSKANKAAAVSNTPELDEKARKRKRYEDIMKKLEAEQAEINSLQGGVVDDEF